MPLQDGFYGKNADGSDTTDYCQFCFQDGAFTKPDMTLEEMIESSVQFMTKNLGFDEAKAREMSNEFIPPLKRWRK